MCLDIRKHGIGVAVARHPQCQNNSSGYDNDNHNDLNLDLNNHLIATTSTRSTCAPNLYKLDIAFPRRQPERRERNHHHATRKTNSKSLTSSTQSPTLTPSKHQIHINDTTVQIHKILKSIVKEYQVCAFLVHWPLSAHGCRIGESCGQVLHTLDQLVAFPTGSAATSPSAASSSSSSSSSSNHPSSIPSQSYHSTSESRSSSILNKNRPFALISVDPEKCGLGRGHDHGRRFRGQQQRMVVDEEDTWGRNSNLSNVQSNPRHVEFSSKRGVTLVAFDDDSGGNEQEQEHEFKHKRSRSQYGYGHGKSLVLPSATPPSTVESPSAVAATILDQFLFTHWPDDMDMNIMPEDTDRNTDTNAALDNCTFQKGMDDCYDEMTKMMNA